MINVIDVIDIQKGETSGRDKSQPKQEEPSYKDALQEIREADEPNNLRIYYDELRHENGSVIIWN